MKKSLFYAGMLLSSCFVFTSCSGGGEGDDTLSVNAMSGRTFVFDSPGNMLGSMYIEVGDRIGSSNVCDARYHFGTMMGGYSRGRVTILSTQKSEDSKKSWEKCDFTFHIDDAEVSEEVNFKAFFALWLSNADTADQGNEDGGNNNNNGGGDQTTSDGMASDSYVMGLEPVKVSMTFKSNENGTYVMEPTTVYLDDAEEVPQTIVIDGGFVIDTY